MISGLPLTRSPASTVSLKSAASRNEPGQASNVVRASCRPRSESEKRTRIFDAVRAPRLGRAFCAGNRQKRQQGNQAVVSSGEHAGGNGQAWRRRLDPVHQLDRSLPQQGKERRGVVGK